MPDDDARAVLAQRVRESLAAYGAVREKNMFGELSFAGLLSAALPTAALLSAAESTAVAASAPQWSP